MIRHETERYRMYADAVRSYARSKGLPEKLPILTFAARSEVSENPERLRNSSYEDVAQLGKIFDNFSPMLYIDIKHRFVMKTDLDWINREIKGYYQQGGADLNLVPFLSVGYPYSTFIGNIEPGVMKAQILEAYASGAKGVVIYSEGWYDALDMKQTAEAMKIILQAEDIFLKGHPIPDHRLENKAKNTLLKGIETSPGNAVLLVSDYSEHEKEAVVHYHFDGKAIVTDMETGKTIAEISAAKPYFKVKLSEVRTKMLRIKMEPADHKPF